jgi:hypothetical protein
MSLTNLPTRVAVRGEGNAVTIWLRELLEQQSVARQVRIISRGARLFVIVLTTLIGAFAIDKTKPPHAVNMAIPMGAQRTFSYSQLLPTAFQNTEASPPLRHFKKELSN